MHHRAPPRQVEGSDVLFRIGGTIACHVFMGLLIQLALEERGQNWVSWVWITLAFASSLLTALGAFFTARGFYRERWYK